MSRWLATILVVAALTAAAASSTSGSSTGIRGRVVAGPTCPVETVPPNPSCAPRGFAARVRVYRTIDRHTVARLSTGVDGRFRVQLRPGRYAVSAGPLAGGPLPRCAQAVDASVRAGVYARVVVVCDTGIR